MSDIFKKRHCASCGDIMLTEGTKSCPHCTSVLTEDQSDAKMETLGGNGVMTNTTKEVSVGKFPVEPTEMGEWPRDHVETPVMCDVDDDGVEHEPEGAVDSTHKEAKDEHTSSVSHDWPAEPKNTDPNPSWDGVNKISEAMGREPDLQNIFDSYARDHEHVCLEDFTDLVRVYGSEAILDEDTMMDLMEANKEFIFVENEDAHGLYWSSTPAPKQSATTGPTRTGVRGFFEAAKRLRTSGKNKTIIGEALTHSWRNHVGEFPASKYTGVVKEAVEALTAEYSSFEPVVLEDSTSTSAIGVGNWSAKARTDWSKKQPKLDKFDDLGDPLDHKSNNTAEDEPTVPGTGKGDKEIKENAARIGRVAKKLVREFAESLPGKLRSVSFAARAGAQTAPKRTTLTEAILDAEELTQTQVEPVVLETKFHLENGKTISQKLSIKPTKPHGPLMNEGSMYFRLAETANCYLAEAKEQGLVGRIKQHSYGYRLTLADNAVASKKN